MTLTVRYGSRPIEFAKSKNALAGRDDVGNVLAGVRQTVFFQGLAHAVTIPALPRRCRMMPTWRVASVPPLRLPPAGGVRGGRVVKAARRNGPAR